jgi:glutathione S-transferase
MRLIGMLDSPYVRRVAISLDVLGVAFDHEAVSVFSTFEKFKSINPVVKAPSLVCDDGTVLMDSSLILQFVEAAKTNSKSLWSKDSVQLQHEFRAVSLAMAACEKAVQCVYELHLRPMAAQYEPWLERVKGQLIAALSLLETEVANRQKDFERAVNQECITIAVVWQFIQSMLPDVVEKNDYIKVMTLSARMELTGSFIKYPPVGPGV